VGGNHPLLKMPNVLCTPHLGWAEWDNFELYFRECFEQIVKFEKGEALRLGNQPSSRGAQSYNPFRIDRRAPRTTTSAKILWTGEHAMDAHLYRNEWARGLQ
jgi:hypothetical protein